MLELRSLENSSFQKLKTYSINSIKFKTKNIYLSNQYTNILNLEQGFKFCYILSSNLKLENIYLSIKLRAKYFKTQITLFSSGFHYPTNLPKYFITLNLNSLFKFFESKNFFSLNVIKEFSSLFIFGNSLNTRFFTTDICTYLKQKFPKSISLSLRRSANSESVSFLNIKPVNTKILQKAQNLFMWCLEDNLFLHKLFLGFKKQTSFIY